MEGCSNLTEEEYCETHKRIILSSPITQPPRPSQANMPKNPHAMALGKLGGAAKSYKKTLAARANIRKRWYMSKRLKEATEHQSEPKASITLAPHSLTLSQNSDKI